MVNAGEKGTSLKGGGASNEKLRGGQQNLKLKKEVGSSRILKEKPEKNFLYHRRNLNLAVLDREGPDPIKEVQLSVESLYIRVRPVKDEG